MVREMYVLTCNLHRAMGSIQSLERGLLPRLVEVSLTSTISVGTERAPGHRRPAAGIRGEMGP